MASLRTKRLAATCGVAAIWLGGAFFVWSRVLPVWREFRSLRAKVAAYDEALDGRISADIIPSRGAIEGLQDLKRSMQQEAEKCGHYYQRRNQPLDRKILKSWRGDPIDLGNEFREFRTKLANKAGNMNVLDLGELDDWAKEEEGKPAREDLLAIEKRSCVAEAVVDVLATESSTVIRTVAIPSPPQPAEAPAIPPQDWPVVRHDVFRVKVLFTTRFSGLGQLLDRIVTSPTGERPCMAVRDIKIEPAGRDRARVEMHLDVYDFYQLEGAY